jgi:hypothetical protein
MTSAKFKNVLHKKMHSGTCAIRHLSVLTWGFYFLATHQDLQEKLYKEIKDVLGKDDVDHTNINDLVSVIV